MTRAESSPARGTRPALAWAWLALGAALVASACVGAFAFTPLEVARHVGDALAGRAPAPEAALARDVLLALRLPRVLLAASGGAALAVAGALLQGLFRNPIVEPGLVGTSAGAALGAALVTVAGAGRALGTTGIVPAGAGAPLLPPLAAFAGALAATWLVHRLARAQGAVSVLALLLAGIAVNALGAAGTGLLATIARDPQARSITFWTLGTYTTATWPAALVVTAALALALAWTRRRARALDALMLGELDAAALGVDVRALVRTTLLVAALLVAACTAVTGIIAFTGLVVPHVARWWRGAAHGPLVVASALLGAAFMSAVDVAARVLVAPAELPVGIITAAIGAPLFLVLLRRTVPGGGDAGAA